MSVIEVESQEQFYELIKQDKVVTLFTAPSWCGPCQKLEPHYEAAATKTDVPFIKIDVDVHPELSAQYLVMSVPTMVLFGQGEVVRGIGGRTAPKILAEL